MTLTKDAIDVYIATNECSTIVKHFPGGRRVDPLIETQDEKGIHISADLRWKSEPDFH